MNEKTIAVDFDLTVVDAKDNTLPGAAEILRELAKNHKIILYTARDSKRTAEAVEWYRRRNIFLSGININPEQESWTNSNKCSADLYIDDRVVGAYLTEDNCLDWAKTEQWLIKNKWLFKAVYKTLESKLKGPKL